MSERIPKILRQAVALSLVGIAGAGFWLLVCQPIFALVADQERRIAEKREVLGRLLSANVLETDARAIGGKVKALEADKLLLKGDSDSLRASELQSALTAIAGAEGIRLKSSRGLLARDQNNARLIGLEARFQATLEQLQKIIIAIEASEPLLLIDALHITAGPGAADPKNDPSLEISIEISGVTGAAKG